MGPAVSPSGSRYLSVTRLLGLLVWAPLLVALSLPVAIHVAQHPESGFSVHRLEIVSVSDGGPARRAGLQPGDRILEVDGHSVATMAEYYAVVAADDSLDPRAYVVDRDGARVRLEITPIRRVQRDMIRDYCTWVTGLAFLAIGWWVLWRRNDPVARDFFALCCLFAFFLVDVPDLPSVSYMMTKQAVRELAQLMMAAFFLRFFLRFPGKMGTRRPMVSQRLTRLLLLPGSVLFLVTLAVTIWHPSPTGSTAQSLLEGITLVYVLAYFLAGLVVFARRALRRDRPIQRSKMAVVLLGLVLGLGPFLITALLGNAVPDRVGEPVQYLTLSLVLVPSSFALAIMRYGALDKTYVVRIGLIYALLTLLLLAVYVLVVLGIGQFLSRVFAVSAYPVLLLIVATSSLAVLPLRRVAQGWIDRTFYPARRVQRQEFDGLADRLTRLLGADDVVRVLLDGLGELFRPEHLVIWTNDEPGAPFTPALAIPVPVNTAEPRPNLLPDSALAHLLRRLRRPVYTEELEDLLLAGGSDPASLALLTSGGTQLAVPLVGGNRLVGFLAFGPKAGGALYSQEDLANLRNLAIQAASVLESRRFYGETLRQQKLETEMAVAREIQAGLLPVATLASDEFVIAGRHESCRTVGGDAFDYFLREDGTLVLAIADVAGKGVPAALLMTSLCTSFRREAEARLAPAAVTTRLNDAVGSRVGPGRFVCFFCAVWDPASGLLTYCNAGMEPPILFRADSPVRQRLRKGGPVLGAAPDHSYREGTVYLGPADRLFLHTDGLADQQDESEEFYDEERLLAAVAGGDGATPAQLLDTIFADVHAFGAGNQTDDMTAILLEIKALKKTEPPGPLLAQAGRDPVDHRGLPRDEDSLKHDV